jgi:DNA anti-recombination protein RmuC
VSVRNTEDTLKRLKALLNHPATSAEERGAAAAAINRILGINDALDHEVKKTNRAFATIFKQGMQETFGK